MYEPLIEVRNLRKHFSSGLFRRQTVRAVDGVSFNIRAGETFGLVGESGCGKSTLGRCIVRLLEPTAGAVLYRGTDIHRHDGDAKTLCRSLQIIFQDADGSLNPRMRTRDLLLEPLRIHGLADGHAREQVTELMETVNLTPDLLDRFPWELSGGQRQRIGIARAISLNPDLIVADEAAASLDLLVQAQMLGLMQRLQGEHGTSYFYISHNLNVVRRFADRVGVMYLGKLVETAPTAELYAHPRHPYTRALIGSMPGIEFHRKKRTLLIEGEPPNPLDPPRGCRFHPRCPQALDSCRESEPELRDTSGGHQTACHLVDK